MSLPPEIHYVNDSVARLYGLACSMRRLADLLDCDDDPFSTLVRLIGEDIENCAVILDEGLDAPSPFLSPEVCDRIGKDVFGEDPDEDSESGWELP